MKLFLVKLLARLAKHRFIASALISFGAIISLIFIGYFTSPNLFRFLIGNLGETSFTVAFITYQPVKACVLVNNPNQITDYEIRCDQTKTNLHLLNFTGKTPNTEYQVRYLVRLKSNILKPSTLTTQSISDTPPGLPEPAYGTVITSDLSPMPESLVLVYPETGLNHVLLTATNSQGNYVVDINSIYPESDYLYLEASTADGLWGGTKIIKDVHAPFPPIQVNSLVKF